MQAPTRDDDLEFVAAISQGAAELVRAELEPLESNERRYLGDLVSAARLLTGESVSRPRALALAVGFLRHRAIVVSRRRVEGIQAELDANRAARQAEDL